MNNDSIELKSIIKEIIDYRGKTPKKLGSDWSNCGYRALSAKNIKTGKIVQEETIRYVDDELYKKWMKQEVERGTILITSEAPFGEVLYWDSDEKIVLSQRIFGLKIDDKYNAEYIYYYMTSREFKGELEARATGSTVTGLRQPELLKCKIKIPNKDNQDKISHVLKCIDKKIELNNQINDNLQKLINNLYVKYFVNFEEYTGEYKDTDLGMIPESFNVDTLGNVITFSNGYGWNSKDMLDTNSENTYKVFKMGNINIGGGINKAKTKSWIDKEKANNLEQYISKKGDILMCMTDMKNSGNPLLGHTALIDKDDEFVINQRVGIIRCDKNLGYSYVYTMSNLKHFINDIRSRANSGVQVNLTTKGICDTLVLVPDNNTLNKFQQIAEPLYEKIFNNNNENETLEQLRDTLLPKLMNGEIDLYKIEI